MRIAVVLRDTIQTTEDTWRVKSVGGVFGSCNSFDDVMEWARKHNKNAAFDMLEFTEVIE